MLLHVDVCKEVHDIAKALLIQFRTGKVLGEDSLQAVVLFFDKAHGFVNLDANLGSVCIGSDYGTQKMPWLVYSSLSSSIP